MVKQRYSGAFIDARPSPAEPVVTSIVVTPLAGELAEGKDVTHGFAVTLQDLLSYDAFRAAARRFALVFRYLPAEGDGGEAAWFVLLRKCVAYPDRKLTDRWGECLPGSTRRGRPLRRLAA